MPVETIKQSHPWSCIAAVAAMVVGATEQDFFDFIGHDGSGVGDWIPGRPFREDSGYTWQELALYLLAHGYTFGLIGITEGIEGYKAVFPISTNVDVGCKIIFEVKSPISDGHSHSIFWDGRTAHDPSPYTNGETTLEDYEILSFNPIVEWKWHDSTKAVNRFLDRLRGNP